LKECITTTGSSHKIEEEANIWINFKIEWFLFLQFWNIQKKFNVGFFPSILWCIQDSAQSQQEDLAKFNNGPIIRLEIFKNHFIF